MLRRKKRERKEKPEPQRFVVVSIRDARTPKYLTPDEAHGFPPEHAQRLAERVPGQKEIYTVIPVEVFQFARARGLPVLPDEAISLFEAEKKNEEGVDDA